METRIKHALELFKEGYDCSHALLGSYADYLGFDEKILQNIHTPCSCLAGRPQNLCGAVTGALSALCQMLYTEDHIKHKITEIDQPVLIEFKHRFIEKYGSIKCTELLGTDISTIQGQKEASDKDLFTNRCEKFISDAAVWLEELLEEHHVFDGVKA